MNAKVITISEARYRELLEKEAFVDVIMDLDDCLERRYKMSKEIYLCPNCRSPIDIETNSCQNCGGQPEWGDKDDRVEFEGWYSDVDNPSDFRNELWMDKENDNE